MRIFYGVLLGALAIILTGAAYNPLSLKEAVSIINKNDGTFDVLCKNHSREIVTEADIIGNNICPNVKPIRKLDLLFVIDNSVSMHNTQVRIAELAEPMVELLVKDSYDFKIAVITTDAYRAEFVNNSELSRFKDNSGHSILTSKTPNLIKAFQENLLQGIQGSGDERAFHSIQASLVNSENKGFVRPDSTFKIVIVSNEDDFSSDSLDFDNDYSNPNLHPVKKYTDFLDAITKSKEPNQRYHVSAIAVFDEDCKSQQGQGSIIGLRYRDLVEATGGTKIDLCGSNVNPLQ